MAVRSRLRRTPTALHLPPPVLHRRYSVEGEVGRGGCACVYQAWDTQLGQFVAIKRAHLSWKEAALLRREADLLASLQHPTIPTILDYFEEGSWSYLVEEWRTGIPVPFLPLQHVLQLGLQCCDALAYLHHRGVLHRDLKPSNVLTDEGVLSLLDFSIACQCSDPPWRAGTRDYASPEQFSKGMIDPSSDIFSMGMLLGCALTDMEAKKVRQTGSFSVCWNDSTTIPDEERPLLHLLDGMIASSPQARPDLSQVIRELERCLAVC